MEEFITQGRKEINNLTNELNQTFGELLTYYRNRFQNNIIDVTNDNIRGMSESRMEYYVNEYFITPLLEEIVKELNQVSEIEEIFRSFYQKLDANQITKERFTQEYENYLAETKRKLSTTLENNIEEITDNFIRTYINNIARYFEDFREISPRNFENNLDEIRSELRSSLRRLGSAYCEEHQNELGKVITRHYNKIEKLTNEIVTNNQNINEEELKEFSTILELTNLEIVKENDRIYIQNKNTHQKFQFEIMPEQTNLGPANRLLIMNGSNIISSYITIKNGQNIIQQYTDSNTGNYLKTQNFTTFVWSNAFEEYFLRKQADGYIFKKGKEESETKVPEVIKNLKNEYPILYEKLSQDPKFIKSINDINAKEDVFINSNTGKLEINPKFKENIIQNLNLIGYELFEKNNAYYAKNTTTQREIELKYKESIDGHGGFYIFEMEDKMVYIGYEKKTGIATNKEERNFSYSNLETDLTIKDLTSFKVHNKNDKKYYEITLTEIGISCKATNQTGQTLQVPDEEIIEKINSCFPSVIEYIAKHYTEKTNKEFPYPNQKTKIEMENINQETILQIINPALLDKKMKLPNEIEISTEQYIQEVAYPQLPKDGIVILSNGSPIPVKQFITENIMNDCQKRYDGDIARYMGENTRSNIGVITIEKDGQPQQINATEITNYINPILLNLYAKLPNGSYISVKEYIEQFYAPHIPTNGYITLANGNEISAKDYIEGILLQEGQSKYNGDISTLLYNTTKKNTGTINLDPKNIQETLLQLKNQAETLSEEELSTGTRGR